MKTAVLKLKFNDMGDLVHKMGVVDFSFGRWMRRDWTHKVGYMRDMFTRFTEDYTKQFGALHLDLKNYLEVINSRSLCFLFLIFFRRVCLFLAIYFFL